MTRPSKPFSTAMLLAAGLGKRMRPLTDSRPKPLIEVAGKTLIDHVLDRLVEARVETAIVNVHYFADQMEALPVPAAGRHATGREDARRGCRKRSSSSHVTASCLHIWTAAE